MKKRHSSSDMPGYFQLYPHQAWWFLMRTILLVVTMVVLIGLWFDIRFVSLGGLSAREVFWFVLMPLIVLLIYFSPMLWRNVCPLATVSLWRFTFFGRRALSRRGLAANQLPGFHGKAHEFLKKKGLLVSAVFFWILVPMRLLVFNASSQGTFWLLVGVFIAAAVIGALFPGKSGWCTSICPIAGAEKAYGLNPAISVQNTRCHFYNKASDKVFNCSGCSFNCSDVVNPEHAYWQSSSNQVFHDTMNAKMRKVFIATLPAFLLSFYFMATGIIIIPEGSFWIRVSFVYSFFAIMMLFSYVLYAHIKDILRQKTVDNKKLNTGKESLNALYVLYKRRLDLTFMTVTMNIIWVFSCYSLVYKVISKTIGLRSEEQLLLWIGLLVPFFALSGYSLYNGWKETPEPCHYKPGWW